MRNGLSPRLCIAGVLKSDAPCRLLRTGGKGRKVDLQACSLDGEARSPVAFLDKSALGKGWRAWGGRITRTPFLAPLRKGWASSAGGDRKAARRAVSVATKEATGIDSRARGSPSPQTIMDSVSRPCYSAVCPSFSRLTATASPCAPPPAMRASSAWRAWASSRVQSVKVLLPRTCLLT